MKKIREHRIVIVGVILGLATLMSLAFIFIPEPNKWLAENGGWWWAPILGLLVGWACTYLILESRVIDAEDRAASAERRVAEVEARLAGPDPRDIAVMERFLAELDPRGDLMRWIHLDFDVRAIPDERYHALEDWHGAWSTDKRSRFTVRRLNELLGGLIKAVNEFLTIIVLIPDPRPPVGAEGDPEELERKFAEQYREAVGEVVRTRKAVRKAYDEFLMAARQAGL